MPALSTASAWTTDLPVCFPGRPCVDYAPFDADAINVTSTLTPVSQAIALGCFALLGVALVLIVLGLRSQVHGPRLRVVLLSTMVILIGTSAEALADLRLSAIAVIFGLEGPGSPDLYGSWSLIEAAGEAMAAAGVAGLAITAAVAIGRLRSSPLVDDVDHP